MSQFHPIVIGTQTFNAVGPGKYALSTVTAGGPSNEIKIAPGRRNPTTKAINASVTRSFDTDVVEGSTTTRRKAIVSVQVTFPDGTDLAKVDNALGDVSTFLTTTTLNEILLGKQ